MSIQYNVIIEKGDHGVLIDWGNTPNWQETHRELLDTADRMTLVPKEGVNLPVVSTSLGEEKRWILVSRVFGTLNIGTNEQEERVRLYALGWQSTVKGSNVKSITWVYPNGMIESAEFPSFAHHFIPQQMRDQIQAAEAK